MFNFKNKTKICFIFNLFLIFISNVSHSTGVEMFIKDDLLVTAGSSKRLDELLNHKPLPFTCENWPELIIGRVTYNTYQWLIII